MTDGRLRYGGAARSARPFTCATATASRRVLAAGIDVAVISGRDSAAVARRCQELGHSPCVPGRRGQGAGAGAAAGATRHSQPRQCACVGDDRARSAAAGAGRPGRRGRRCAPRGAGERAPAHPPARRRRRGARGVRLAARCPAAQRTRHDAAHPVRAGGARALGTLFYLQQPTTAAAKRSLADVESTEPGYIANGAELIETGDDGHPLFRLDAERIEQPQPQGTIFLTEPKLDYQPETGNHWTLSAQRASCRRTPAPQI